MDDIKVKAPAPKCGAKTRSEDGHPCGQYAERGTNRCRFHGARSPGVLRVKAENLAFDRVEQKAVRLLRQQEVTDVENPLRALAQLAGTVVAWQKVMQEMVEKIKDLRYVGAESGEQIRGEVILFERSMDRAASVLTSMARLDIDSRLVRIEERQAELIEGCLLAAMYDVHLDPVMMEKLLAATGKRLRIDVVI